MKKIFLTLGVASLALSSFAGQRILYQQNFETAESVEATGWTYGGASISIASDAFGKFLELNQGQTNGRSAQVTWGQDIFMKDGASVLEDGTYNLKFDFSIKQGSNNQYNSEFTVFTNHTPIANNLYRTPWSQKPEASCWDNYLFDMSQVDKEPLMFAIDGPTKVTTAEDGTKTYEVDKTEANTFEAGQWYTVELNVNVNTREVEYSVSSLAGDIVKQGTRKVPEADINGDPISMYAEGLFIMVARYATIYDIDNIVVSYESSVDFANAPTVALTRVGQTADETLDLAMRAYTITFIDGETLHVLGTDGKEESVEYADCEGAYVYETTTSGVLKAWTTVGEAKSEVVEATVDCTPIALPEVVATITSVGEGFTKTYTLSVDNSDVPLRPTIFIDYEFTGNNGEKLSKEGVASGEKVTVSQEGTLKVTSLAFGYQETTKNIKNDLQFETKRVYDFARMSEEDIKAAGFPAFTVLNSDATSGFNNWTARKRLYYNVAGTEHENEAGETVYDAAYPFGFVAADNEVNVIKYAVIDNTGNEDIKPESYFEGLSIFPDKGKKTDGYPNVGMMYRIGLFNDETKNNNNNIIIKDLAATDFVVVNSINNYGGNSIHPVVSSDEEYFKVLAGEDAVYSVATDGVLNEETQSYDVTHALYRIDTACTKITVFKQAGSSAVETITNEVVGDNWYYSIDGMRMENPTRPGIYIHNGKKVIIK